MSKYLVEVAPTVPLKSFQRQTYTYYLAKKPTSVFLHRIVTIPFGYRRIVKGIIMGESAHLNTDRIKEAQLTTLPSLTFQQVALAEWISRTMKGGLGYTLRLFMPPSSTEYSLPGLSDFKHPIFKPAEAYISAHWQERLKKIYTHSIKKVPRNAQILILVPEIWMAERVYTCLKEMTNCSMALVHGKISSKKYGQIWQNVYDNKCSLIIGTQKALFLPFQNLTMIIFEEEGFESHSIEEQYPRLPNIYAVKKMAELFSSQIIYTSISGSINLWHEIRTGVIKPILVEPISLQLRFITPATIHDELLKIIKKKKRITILYNRLNQYPIRQLIPHSDKIDIGTTAILPFLSQQKTDQLVWLFPEHVILFPDFRSYERGQLLLSRLQEIQPEKEVILVSRYPQLISDYFNKPIETVITAQLTERRMLHLPPFTDIVRVCITSKSTSTAFKRAVTVREQLSEKYHELQINGPVMPSKRITGPVKEVYIFLRGNVSDLTKIYTDLPIDSVVLNPSPLF